MRSHTIDTYTCHMYQELIYIQTLEAIANGADYPRQLAEQALKAKTVIPFEYRSW